MTERDRTGQAATVDALVRRARAANVRRDVAIDHVRALELDRWAARDRAARAAAGGDLWTRLRWLVAGVALASAAATALWLAFAPPAVHASIAARSLPAIPASAAPAQPPPAIAARPLPIGDRVALIAAAGAAYRVITATAAATAIEIDDGAVTARVWPGLTPHPLTVTGGGVRVVAGDAVFELAVIDGRASVAVMRGAVDAGAIDGAPHPVAAGERWPAGAPEPADRSAVESLLAIASPSPAHIATRPIARAVPPAPAITITSAPTLTIKDRWREARLLRGQGKLAAAVAACLAIADANDSTWSPIALVEAIEIDAGPLADPEHAVELADRFLRAWPTLAATRDVRALRCKSLAQLGRAAECAPPAP